MDKRIFASAVNLRLAANNLSHDLVSSVVVALVAIPLCLGIALASGVPLFSGVIAGIIGGILVGILSQSHASVSGPAAGLAALVVEMLNNLGTFEALLLAITIAGVVQIVVGLLRAGFIADYIPSNVVQGLLAAVGILIILKQLPFAFGYVQGNDFLALLRESQEEFLGTQHLMHLLTHINLGAALISIISLFILIYWSRIKISAIRAIPAAVVVVLIGVGLNGLYFYVWPTCYLSSPDYLVNLPVVKTITEFPSLFTMPDFSQWKNINIYIAGLTIAAVASLETLLNLEAIEKIDKNKRYCSRNREMLAQGCGNILSGLIGGLPITSVIVRSSVNIESGAKTKLSAIFHGFILLIVALFLPKWINCIPLASLAAILIHTGYKLASIKMFKSVYRLGFSQFFPFIVTTLAIIFTSLLTGILVGLSIAIFFILRNSSTRFFDIVKERYPHGTVLHLIMPEQVTFLNKAAFISELHSLPRNAKVILDGSNIDYIDYDIVELIKDFANARAPRKNIQLNVIGFEPETTLANCIEFPMTTTQEMQRSLHSAAVLELLIEGNQRFVNNQPIHRHFRHQIQETSVTQHPLAVVLGCIDSRVPVEIIFDQGIGDIFCARVAGNVANEDILGSMEYAISVAGAKLIVVMGHKECGAIKAACDGVQLGNITELLKKIRPALEQEKTITENRNSTNPHFVEDVTRINIKIIQDYIYRHSTVLRDLINEGKILMIGGLYDVKSGKVEWLLDDYR